MQKYEFVWREAGDTGPFAWVSPPTGTMFEAMSLWRVEWHVDDSMEFMYLNIYPRS